MDFSETILAISANIFNEDNLFSFDKRAGYSFNLEKIWDQLICSFSKEEIICQIAKQLGITPLHVGLTQFKTGIYQIINAKLAKLKKPIVSKDVVYRFTDTYCYPDLTRENLIISLRQIWDYGLLADEEVKKILNNFGDINFKFKPAFLQVLSSQRHNITLHDYCHGKEKDGHIVGFYLYWAEEKGIFNTKQIINAKNLSEINPDWYHKKIFIAIKPTFVDFEKINQEHKIITVFGQYGLDNNLWSSVEITDNIGYVKGVVKEFYAGKVLPEQNISEINWVGDFELVGYTIKIPTEIFNSSICPHQFLNWVLELFGKSNYFFN